jgi:hypothetical protein
MKISLRPASRWPVVPLWAVGFVVLWASVVILARVVAWRTGARLDLCLFHRLTGHPCPTCGTTRGLLAMARGAWRESFAWNPLTMMGAVIGSLAVAGRVVTAKTLEFQLTSRERRLLLTVGLVLLGINWIWLIYSQR